MGELELEKLRNGVAGFHLHLQGIHSFSILAACVTRIVRGVVIGGIGWGMVMRSIVLTAATVLALIGGFAHAKSTNDETFANAALRELHNLAVASAQSERSAKDSDRLGCRDAYDSLQKAAHEALTNMHRMSFAPIGALKSVSTLLRVSNLSPDKCPDDAVTQIGALPMMAGQAIMGLRTDYAIGDADWYMVNASGAVEARNALRYAQSLNDEAYYSVDIRPKGAILIAVLDWKAEMASHDVGDPAIEDLGYNLKAVEVVYRKKSDDDDALVYFYRTREDAQAAKQQQEDDAKAAADVKASNAMWRQKLMSLPYMIANRDPGFKLTHAVCKPAGKDAKGEDTCSDDGSYDWSDNRAVPYRWWGDINACYEAEFNLNKQHPADVDPNGNFVTRCVPAPPATKYSVKGYKMIFTLRESDDPNDTIYADLRQQGSSQSPTMFKTFSACSDAEDAAYPKAMKDLGADDGGIDLTITCVRLY